MQVNAVGTPLGILIGLLSGIVVLWLFSTIRKATVKEVPIIIAQCLSLAGLWSGGAWAPGALLKSMNFDEVLPSYLLSVMVVFSLFTLLGLGLWLTGYTPSGNKNRPSTRSDDD